MRPLQPAVVCRPAADRDGAEFRPPCRRRPAVVGGFLGRMVRSLPHDGPGDRGGGGGLRAATAGVRGRRRRRSEEHTSELQSLMRISYAVFCLQKKTTQLTHHNKLV